MFPRLIPTFEDQGRNKLLRFDITASLAAASGRPRRFYDPSERSVWSSYATILRLFGIDHNALTYKFRGLDQRLTPVTREAQPIMQLIA